MLRRDFVLEQAASAVQEAVDLPAVLVVQEVVDLGDCGVGAKVRPVRWRVVDWADGA